MQTSHGSLVNNSEAARQLGLSESMLCKLRLTGGGPNFIKLGRRVLYSEQDLNEWVTRHRRTSTSDKGPAVNDR